MAIKVNGTTVIDDSRNISNVGTVTATSFSGNGSALTGIDSGGVTLLGTLNTTSGSSVTLSGLTLTGYKLVYYVLDGVSLTAGDDDVCLQVGDYDHRVGRIPNFGTFIMHAHGSIDLLSGVASTQTGGIYNTAGTWFASSLYSGGIITTYSQSSTSITFLSRSSAFDAGSIHLYGVA